MSEWIAGRPEVCEVAARGTLLAEDAALRGRRDAGNNVQHIPPHGTARAIHVTGLTREVWTIKRWKLSKSGKTLPPEAEQRERNRERTSTIAGASMVDMTLRKLRQDLATEVLGYFI